MPVWQIDALQCQQMAEQWFLKRILVHLYDLWFLPYGYHFCRQTWPNQTFHGVARGGARGWQYIETRWKGWKCRWVPRGSNFRAMIFFFNSSLFVLYRIVWIISPEPLPPNFFLFYIHHPPPPNPFHPYNSLRHSNLPGKIRVACLAMLPNLEHFRFRS